MDIEVGRSDDFGILQNFSDGPISCLIWEGKQAEKHDFVRTVMFQKISFTNSVIEKASKLLSRERDCSLHLDEVITCKN